MYCIYIEARELGSKLKKLRNIEFNGTNLRGQSIISLNQFWRWELKSNLWICCGVLAIGFLTKDSLVR